MARDDLFANPASSVQLEMAARARWCVAPPRAVPRRRAGGDAPGRARRRRGRGASAPRAADGPPPAEAASESIAVSTGRSASDDAKTELWERWWFEARNADALAVLAKMPGADVNRKTRPRIDPKGKVAFDPGGLTACALAAQRDDAASIRVLASLGADLNARDANGACALHHAAFADAADAADALVDLGADANAQDARDGSTAVILAAYGARRETLRRLVARHPVVDLSLRDVGNATVAGHCAQRRLADELLTILKLCGPGGAGRLLRGEKVYLGKRRELTGQLEARPVPFLEDFRRRLSSPTPRFQRPPPATPFNSI